MNNTEKALNYYRSAVEDKRPDFVPSRIRLPLRVTGDDFNQWMVAEAGDYDCESNQWGAVSVKTRTGRMLGIKPSEFEPLEWRDNTMT